LLLRQTKKQMFAPQPVRLQRAAIPWQFLLDDHP